MKIAIIAAVSDNNVIGYKGKIPWHIPEDLKRFKELTTGYPVIMGRKTWESLPVKPLPERFNIVLSSDLSFYDSCFTPHEICRTLLEARAYLAGDSWGSKAYIIGGSKLYEEALPLADEMYLTRVHTGVEGDAFFPKFDESDWRKVEVESRDGYSFIKYERR